MAKALSRRSKKLVRPFLLRALSQTAAPPAAPRRPLCDGCALAAEQIAHRGNDHLGQGYHTAAAPTSSPPASRPASRRRRSAGHTATPATPGPARTKAATSKLSFLGRPPRRARCRSARPRRRSIAFQLVSRRPTPRPLFGKGQFDDALNRDAVIRKQQTVRHGRENIRPPRDSWDVPLNELHDSAASGAPRQEDCLDAKAFSAGTLTSWN